VLFVAVFIILFSTFFKQVDNIYMFFDISAALYLGAAGTVLLAGLYWKRGTVKAAWSTMIFGAVASISGFICRQINPDFLDGRLMAFWISIMCFALYIIVSLFDKKPDIDFDELFNRTKSDEQPDSYWSKIRKWFQWGSEVPKGDRILIPLIYAAIALFLATFIGIGIYNTTVEVSAEKWANFWEKYLYTMFFLATIFMVWIMVGGIKDLIKMFRGLKSQEVDEQDDGSVKGHHAAR
jgi:SSS family solute:Na+ symporter